MEAVSSVEAPPEIERLYRVPEVAAILSMSVSMTWKLVWRGELRSILIGAARRVPAGAVREFLAAATAAAAAATPTAETAGR